MSIFRSLKKGDTFELSGGGIFRVEKPAPTDGLDMGQACCDNCKFGIQIAGDYEVKKAKKKSSGRKKW